MIRSLIPARIDRLPWSRFHTRMVLALGVAWILDGLEITIAANLTADLTQKNTLHLTAAQSADIATWYLIGEVFGALFFGQLSDKLGRKNLFMVTLGVYLIGSGLTALTPRGGYWFIFLYATRVLAGSGIGGEYAAINSAIDEMIPARYRGRVDLAVNGTYWAGAFIGAVVTLFALNHFSTGLGWRVAHEHATGRPAATPVAAHAVPRVAMSGTANSRAHARRGINRYPWLRPERYGAQPIRSASSARKCEPNRPAGRHILGADRGAGILAAGPPRGGRVMHM